MCRTIKGPQLLRMDDSPRPMHARQKRFCQRKSSSDWSASSGVRCTRAPVRNRPVSYQSRVAHLERVSGIPTTVSRNEARMTG